MWIQTERLPSDPGLNCHGMFTWHMGAWCCCRRRAGEGESVLFHVHEGDESGRRKKGVGEAKLTWDSTLLLYLLWLNEVFWVYLLKEVAYFIIYMIIPE